MKLRYYLISIFLIFFSTNTFAAASFLTGVTYEVCEVKQDYAFNYYTADGDDFWKLHGKVNFLKGELWGEMKHKDRNYSYKIYENGNDAVPLKVFKDSKFDRLELTDGYSKFLTKGELFNCYKNQVSRKKIEYNTYNIFTQNDLFNGLNDNQKVKGFGYLEVPNFKECKGIKKFPVMFLVHHAGGNIMSSYKYNLQKKCIATFEPLIFQTRDEFKNSTTNESDIKWITETQGALDVLKAIDVVAKEPSVDPSKIGIMGWSYGGIVSIEAQNMFNINLVKPKNQFALHLAYYSFCYQYENTNTTDAPLTIFIGKADKTPYTLCQEWIDQISVNKPQKQIVIYENALHNFDGEPIRADRGSIPDPQCRIYTDNNGEEWVKPDDPELNFNITQNGGWFGFDGDPVKRSRAKKFCWEAGSFEAGRDQEAFEDSWQKFNDYVDTYLNPFDS